MVIIPLKGFMLTKYFWGMTTVEHALPVPTLYDDVLTLYALSGTGSTPTHIVNYGGAWGEQFVWANEDIPNDPKYALRSRYPKNSNSVAGWGISRGMTS
jgi:hypothetical protein